MLLEDAELSLTPGDKLALVGRNGSGKSTLLKIAAGEIVPDGGKRFLQPGVTLRYLPHEPDLTAFPTTLAYVEDGLDAPEFLSAIVRLAETLHVATIGEGVETRAQLAELQAAECRYGQGYLLARPGPIGAVPAVVSVVTQGRGADRRSA